MAAAAAAAQLALFSEPETPQEQAPTVAPVRVQYGDLWQLGRHRLLCGDSTDAAMVAHLMAGERARLALHDPPYGNQHLIKTLGDGTRYGRTCSAKGRFAPITGNDRTFDPRHLLKSGRVVVLWGANHYAHLLPSTACWLIWDKRVDLPSNGFSDAEIAWVSTGGSMRIIRHRWNGMIRDSERGERRVHPTQKPLAVQEEIIRRYTSHGDLVADWYLGSGTTLIACERTGRRCYGAEIEPHYCDVILRRWEQATGQRATLLERTEGAAA